MVLNPKGSLQASPTFARCLWYMCTHQVCLWKSDPVIEEWL